MISRIRAKNKKVLERCQKDCDSTKNCIGFEHAGNVDTSSECNILTGSGVDILPIVAGSTCQLPYLQSRNCYRKFFIGKKIDLYVNITSLNESQCRRIMLI